MRRRKDEPSDQLDQFEAYGKYGYAYRHAAENRRRAQDEEPDAPPEAQPERYAEPEPPPLTPEEARAQAEERARARARSITGRLIVLFALAFIGLAVLQGIVFKLTTVYVVGNVTKTAQDVAATSGLVQGLNMFAISEDDIRHNLDADHTIVFLGMRKVFPHTIYLYISERQAVASTQWLGLLYTLDAEGMVMDERNTLEVPENMPSVEGFQVTNIHVGQQLDVRDREQLRAYYDIMSELNLQYYVSQVREINLSNPKDIYLLTAGGISVRLGSRDYMRAKIGAMRTDMAYLQQLGKNTGVLDVTIPEDAKYRPDS